MKRSLSLILFLLLLGQAVFSASPSAATRVRLRQLESRHAQSRSSDDEKDPYLPLIVQIEEECVLDSLLDLGSILWHRRGDLALMSIPVQDIDSALQMHGIGSLSLSSAVSPSMDLARPFGHVDAVQQGMGLSMGYDGSGVTVGFSDLGFDPHHIAFADRLAAFYVYDASQGTRLAYDTPELLVESVTDDPKEFHATHVANILAGGFRGNPYYGVATGSEIVATTSPLDDVSILCGVEEVIAIAKEKGTRAVVNLSLGSHLGPHDGTDLVCRYLSMCAQDAVICLSAANAGEKNISARHAFSGQDQVRRLTVNNSKTWDGFHVEGGTEAWSWNDREFDVRVEVYDTEAKEIVWFSPWVGGDDGSLTVDSIACPEWNEYFHGSVEVETGVSALNGRYCAAIGYDVSTEPQSSKGKWSRYLTAIAFRGSDGVTMDVFADVYSSYFGRTSGSETLNPGPQLSISDMCTAHGVISVGACSTRNTAPKVDGSPFAWNFSVPGVAAFSSYGFGLPQFCAPGNFVVSAMSGPYHETYPEIPYSCVTQVDGVDYYWFPECGTSMSAPYTTGVVAMWLQACPELTVDEILQLAVSTAMTDYPDMANPRWGAGCLDAYAGLKKLLSRPTIDSEGRIPLVRVLPDGRVEITMPGNVAPKRVSLVSASGMACDISQPLGTGVYVLKIDGYPAYKLVR